MKKVILSLLICIHIFPVLAQKKSYYGPFNQEDKLRGSLNENRACFDVKFYHLRLNEINFQSKQIAGELTMQAEMTTSHNQIQLDLFEQLKVELVTVNGQEVNIIRSSKSFLVPLGRMYAPGEKLEVKVHYKGAPRIAVNAPWHGGLSWTKDEYGRDWMSVSCQGLGASVWWPNKDHLSDEPDSMRVSLVQVSDSMWSISNGSFLGLNTYEGKSYFDYKISYPINNYNVSMYIGHYTHFSEKLWNGGDSLDLAYLVIKGNEEKAKKHFSIVPEMLQCFEFYFGPYPFFKDGFALVEAPYAGMEHQSAIAYGNKYRKGYLGADYSGMNLDFDFIIVHEAGHEYWGNNVSMKDISDMWIHEGFCTYAEVLYVDCIYGAEKALKYINLKKSMIQFDAPLLSPKGYNAEPSSDIYPKGALFVHTLKSIPENDSSFYKVLKSIQTRFSMKTVDTDDIRMEFEKEYNRDLKPIFDAYLTQILPPGIKTKFQQKKGEMKVLAKWVNVPKNMSMPAYFIVDNLETKVELNTEWKAIYSSKNSLTKFAWNTDKQFIMIY